MTHFMLGAAILSFVLTGCSSGKGGSSAASSQSVTGVAATGTPIVGTVSLQDSSSPALVRTTTSADNGAFTVDVSGLVPPYLLNVDWTDNTGRHKMYSFAEQAGTANINPFSNVAFAATVGISDQVALAANFDPAMYLSIASRYEAACDNLRTALGPLFELFQTANDPVTDTFNADHTGLDALFDNVKIFVSNGMIVVTNKDPYRLIFKGPINNITAGTFYPQNMPTIVATGGGAIDGAALYRQYCASCHDPLAASKKAGATALQIQAGIRNVGQMSSLSTLTQAQIEAIAAALATTSTPPPPASTDGAALYARYCSGCHKALDSSTVVGRTSTQIQAAIASQGQMSSLSMLTQTQIDAIAAAFPTTTTPPPPPMCGSCHAIPPATGQHAYHVNSQRVSCGTCHGSGYSSTSVNSATHYNGVKNIASGSTPGWNPATRSCSNSCHGTHYWGGTASTPPPPATTDGAALYTQYCSGCHKALDSSTVVGRTSTQIQAAIASQSQMSSLSTLTQTQIEAIAAAFPTTTTPPPLVCGDCHAIPPATGQHAYHVNSQRVSCGTCHGSGYSSTAVNSATHMNGTVNIASTPGWNPTTRSCSNTCHGTHSWGGTTSTPPPPTTTTDGAALYQQYCYTCHRALDSSTVVGRTSTQIQAAIASQSQMSSLSSLTQTQIDAIAAAFPTTTTPPPPPVCGSCHAIPPGTGHHSTHRSRSCSTCHGTGYSSTTVNTATHNNGVKNIASGSTPGWNPTTRSCSNSCHGTERW
jgi:mono/diheme cytochrome c family protein